MAFVKLKRWVYWKPDLDGESITGIFTGFHTMESRETHEQFVGVGLRCEDGSRICCTRNRAVAMFRDSAVPVGAVVRLTYRGGVMFRPNPESTNGSPPLNEYEGSFYHEFDLEIDQ